MKFKENETVRITKDFDDNVKKNDAGVVLMAFEKPREAYEVEVFNEKGEPKTQCTLLPNDLETFAQIPHSDGCIQRNNCSKIINVKLTSE